MVAMNEEVQRAWECDRERRELAELEQLAECLHDLYGWPKSTPRCH